MPWWGWVVLGAGLLSVEMFLIDAQFYLVFLGVSAAVVGILGLAGIAMPDWLQWLVFGALALVAVVGFRRRLYQRLRGGAHGAVQDRITVGDTVVIPVRLEPGQTCRVDYRGTTWTARNTGSAPIGAGSEVPISRVDDLTLHVISPAAG